MTDVLIHRYDNLPDIRAIEGNRCSDVYTRAQNDNFEYVIIVPTGAAKTNVAVIAKATSGQYTANSIKEWPGRPDDGYLVRVNLTNIQYTTLDKVRTELKRVGKTWAAQWQVTTATIDLANIL
ncbi:hypothetical protein ACWPKS_02790 [Coraliomargarita sp. W4R72]